MSNLYDLLAKMIGELNKTIKTKTQMLAEDQKLQARANIGAANQAEVNRLSAQVRKSIIPPSVDSVAHQYAKSNSKDNISDVTTWTSVSTPLTQRQRTCVYGNGYYVVCGTSGEIGYSLDGVTWISIAKFTSGVITGVAYGKGLFVAIDSNGVIWIAEESPFDWESLTITWKLVPDGVTPILEGICYANNRFVLVGNHGIVAFSDNGRTWTETSVGFEFKAVAFGKGRYVGVGNSGAVAVSYDGENWTAYSDPDITGSYRAAAFGGGRFVIGCQGGIIRYSDDGRTWTTATTNSTSSVNYIRGIVYAEGKFYAVMYVSTGKGEIWVSDDAETWIVQQVTDGRLWCCAYGDGIIITSGDNGAIYALDFGVEWLTKQPELADGQHLWERIVFTLSDGSEVIGDSVYIKSDGVDGKDGYTPIKGVDYFDGKDGADGKDAELVQSLGESEDKAISQRVVTSHLTDHRKRIESIEQELNFTSFVTDDSVAYAKTVPINTLTYAEVNKIGGMTRKCTNLFSANAETPRLSGTTNYTVIDDNTISGCAALGAGESFIRFSTKYLAGTYTLRSKTQGHNLHRKFVFCYDSNGEAITDGLSISGMKYNNYYKGFYAEQDEVLEVTIPSSVAYWTFGVAFPYIDGSTIMTCSNIQVSNGVNIPYEPYFEGLRSAKVTEIESMGANLTTAKEVYVGADRYLETVVDGRNCIRFTSGVTIKKTPVKFKANTQYTVSFYTKSENFNGATSGNSAFTFFYNDGTYEFVYAPLDDTDWKLYSLTSQSGKTVESVGIYSREYRAYTYIDTDTFMLNEGTTALPYSPYTKKTYPISEAIKALDGYGWGINESVYNYVDFENKQFVKRVGIANGECYELAEPIITDISDILPDDNYIGVEGGGTVTMVNEHRYDVPSEITYQVKRVMA